MTTRRFTTKPEPTPRVPVPELIDLGGVTVTLAFTPQEVYKLTRDVEQTRENTYDDDDVMLLEFLGFRDLCGLKVRLIVVMAPAITFLSKAGHGGS